MPAQALFTCYSSHNQNNHETSCRAKECPIPPLPSPILAPLATSTTTTPSFLSTINARGRLHLSILSCLLSSSALPLLPSLLPILCHQRPPTSVFFPLLSFLTSISSPFASPLRPPATLHTPPPSHFLSPPFPPPTPISQPVIYNSKSQLLTSIYHLEVPATHFMKLKPQATSLLISQSAASDWNAALQILQPQIHETAQELAMKKHNEQTNHVAVKQDTSRSPELFATRRKPKSLNLDTGIQQKEPIQKR